MRLYLTKNSIIKKHRITILLIILMILNPNFCLAKDDGVISIKLDLFENTVYGRNYTYESDVLRLNRLEKSLFGKCQMGTEGSRLQKLEQKVNGDKAQKALDRESVLLCMIEKRYFGEDFKTDSIESRINRLEEMVFGNIQSGPLYERYHTLLKKIPAQNGV